MSRYQSSALFRYPDRYPKIGGRRPAGKETASHPLLHYTRCMRFCQASKRAEISRKYRVDTGLDL